MPFPGFFVLVWFFFPSPGVFLVLVFFFFSRDFRSGGKGGGGEGVGIFPGVFFGMEEDPRAG